MSDPHLLPGPHSSGDEREQQGPLRLLSSRHSYSSPRHDWPRSAHCGISGQRQTLISAHDMEQEKTVQAHTRLACRRFNLRGGAAAAQALPKSHCSPVIKPGTG